ncbi:unnamed protein product [Withania somnifera]
MLFALQYSWRNNKLFSLSLFRSEGKKRLLDCCTKDGSTDRHGKPAIKAKTGGWKSGSLLLVSEGLAAVAFTGAEVNMVLFSKTVLRQSNAEAATMFSKWMGTLYIFSLLGAFLSDSYLGRYLTSVVFLAVMNVISPYCTLLQSHLQVLSGNNCVYQEKKLTVPTNGEGLYEARGRNEKDSNRRISHTDDFRFLDRAAVITPSDMLILPDKSEIPKQWTLCTVTQVEEVKCVLRLLPIWFCTILASIVFVQVLSLFVEQGSAMNTRTMISGFHIPPASMTAFDIISTSTFIICYEKILIPLYVKLTKCKPKLPSELQRIGIGLVISTVAMVIAGLVEQHRLRFANDGGEETSSVSIFWQTPQYVLVGVGEAFIYVAQWEFFASQIPDSLKSMGLGLSMSSSALGSYLCSIILSIVTKITTRHGKPGWIPANLNDGHLDRFFFLSAALTALDLVLFIMCAKRYKSIALEKREVRQEIEATA